MSTSTSICHVMVKPAMIMPCRVGLGPEVKGRLGPVQSMQGQQHRHVRAICMHADHQQTATWYCRLQAPWPQLRVCAGEAAVRCSALGWPCTVVGVVAVGTPRPAPHAHSARTCIPHAQRRESHGGSSGRQSTCMHACCCACMHFPPPTMVGTMVSRNSTTVTWVGQGAQLGTIIHDVRQDQTRTQARQRRSIPCL